MSQVIADVSRASILFIKLIMLSLSYRLRIPFLENIYITRYAYRVSTLDTYLKLHKESQSQTSLKCLFS